MKISVIGPGRWGTFIAHYLACIGHRVTLCGREGSAGIAALKSTGKNEYMTLCDRVEPEYGYSSCRDADAVAVSVPSTTLKEVLSQIDNGKNVILCMKGLEANTGRRLSEIAESILPDSKICVWVGPGHVQDLICGIPNCMVIDGGDKALVKRLVDEFSSPLIRFYYGNDLIGCEIGAAAKNVIGIAAGMLDGANMSSLKGALMSRGTREIARLIHAMGGSELTAYGLSHLGDYEATLFSDHSRNRAYGMAFIKGEDSPGLAEGVNTVKALMVLGERYGVELPICTTVCNIIHRGCDPMEELALLFQRSVKKEFERLE